VEARPDARPEPAARPAQQPSTPEDARVTHQIVRAARFLSRDGASEITLRLDPPDLGEVTIRLAAEDRHLSGQIRVENRAIQDIVERNIGELRQALSDRGIDVRQLDVSVDDQGRSASQREAFSFLQERQNRTAFQDRPRGGMTPTVAAEPAAVAGRSDGRVDFIA
jgi:flagellar hook-length control protein FliK